MGADFAGVELFGTAPKFKGKNTSSASLLNVQDKKKLWRSRAETAKMKAKSAMHIYFCCFALINRLFFDVFVAAVLKKTPLDAQPI